MIGIENVRDEKPELQEFTDPYDNRERLRFTASCMLQPASSEEVQGIVRIASRHTVPL